MWVVPAAAAATGTRAPRTQPLWRPARRLTPLIERRSSGCTALHPPRAVVVWAAERAREAAVAVEQEALPKGAPRMRRRQATMTTANSPPALRLRWRVHASAVRVGRLRAGCRRATPRRSRAAAAWRAAQSACAGSTRPVGAAMVGAPRAAVVPAGTDGGAVASEEAEARGGGGGGVGAFARGGVPGAIRRAGRPPAMEAIACGAPPSAARTPTCARVTSATVASEEAGGVAAQRAAR